MAGEMGGRQGLQAVKEHELYDAHACFQTKPAKFASQHVDVGVVWNAEDLPCSTVLDHLRLLRVANVHRRNLAPVAHRRPQQHFHQLVACLDRESPLPRTAPPKSWQT